MCRGQYNACINAKRSSRCQNPLEGAVLEWMETCNEPLPGYVWKGNPFDWRANWGQCGKNMKVIDPKRDHAKRFQRLCKDC
jgi:hypothetical protein